MFLQFANDLVAYYNDRYNASLPSYRASGSGRGAGFFLNGSYIFGSSDVPLTSEQEARAALVGEKITIPIAIASYSFLTRKASGLCLTASQIASIYKASGITEWSSIKKGLTGKIIPVARFDSSGTTKLVSQWLRTSEGWPVPSTASWSSIKTGFFKSNVVYIRGSSGVALLLNENINAIGYLQTGVGLAARAYEIGLYNPSRRCVFATKSDPYQVIPSSLPLANGSWSSVSLVANKGKSAYPLASFIYNFIYTGAGKPKSSSVVKAVSTARRFANFAQSAGAQGLLNSKYSKTLHRLPGKLNKKNLKAIKKIV